MDLLRFIEMSPAEIESKLEEIQTHIAELQDDDPDGDLVYIQKELQQIEAIWKLSDKQKRELRAAILNLRDAMNVVSKAMEIESEAHDKVADLVAKAKIPWTPIDEAE